LPEVREDDEHQLDHVFAWLIGLDWHALVFGFLFLFKKKNPKLEKKIPSTYKDCQLIF
jgi:hypothetical protein